MADYRVLAPNEMPEALDLWVKVFQVERPFFQSLLDGDADSGVSVGAFDRDKLVSSVHIFPRYFRDLDGAPQKVGGIGSVSTQESARAQGHSSKLLQLAIKEMERMDCVWSYLGTGVNDHYAKQGWRTVSTPSIGATLHPGSGHLKPAPVDDDVLTKMAEIHRDWSQDKPMSNDRTPLLWDTAIRYRVTQSVDEVHLTDSAYTVTRSEEDALVFVEAACLPNAEQEIDRLIESRIRTATQPQAYWRISPGSTGADAFRGAVKSNWLAEDRAWMALPIAERIATPTLHALLAAPTGRRSDLDNF